MFIPLNPDAYSPNTLNQGSPKQANQSVGKGFFTTPGRAPSGTMQRTLSSTFQDVWSQPRLFYNSLHQVERQFLVNGFRFEISQVTSTVVKQNMLIQLNRISNDLATRVATGLGMDAPKPDETYYHDNTTEVLLGAFGSPLKRLDGLKIGILSTVDGYDQASHIKTVLTGADEGVDVSIVTETLVPDAEDGMTYSAADATAFDGIIVANNTSSSTSSPFFPTGRPLQILLDAYRYGKPIGAMGDTGIKSLDNAGIAEEARGEDKGVFTFNNADMAAETFLEGLKVFRYLGRFELDEGVKA